jgi:type IV pilus assembly protein PilE
MFARGVTLMEILVVLLVAGVIVALALPAYRQQMVRVNRSEATTALYEIAAAEERYYLRHGRYVEDIAAPPPRGLGLAGRAGSRHYSMSVAVASDGQTFIASATPTRAGDQDGDGACLAFSLDHRGRRAVSGSRETTFCWR